LYIPSFIKTDSVIQKLIGGIHRQTDSVVIAYAHFYFFQNKESRLKGDKTKRKEWFDEECMKVTNTKNKTHKDINHKHYTRIAAE
jgi:hypothetical protein